MDQIFFDDWEGIYRVAVTTVIAYILVIVMLRISGKRTLSKMNAFDAVVTFALGSILATIILSKSTPIAEGLTAIALLIFLQYIISSITVRSKKFKKIISSEPSLLFYEGKMLKKTMKDVRVSDDELNKSVRESGESGFRNITAIILEPTGDITVIKKQDSTSNEAMNDICIN